MSFIRQHGLLLGGVTLAGLGIYALTRPTVPGLPVAPPAGPPLPVTPPLPSGPTPSIPGLSQAVMYPDLALGDHILVDPVKTNMQPALQAFPAVEGIVDFVLTDKAVISIKVVSPPGLPYEGTIPRLAILRLLPKASPAQSA